MLLLFLQAPLGVLPSRTNKTAAGPSDIGKNNMASQNHLILDPCFVVRTFSFTLSGMQDVGICLDRHIDMSYPHNDLRCMCCILCNQRSPRRHEWHALNVTKAYKSHGVLLYTFPSIDKVFARLLDSGNFTSLQVPWLAWHLADVMTLPALCSRLTRSPDSTTWQMPLVFAQDTFRAASFRELSVPRHQVMIHRCCFKMFHASWFT